MEISHEFQELGEFNKVFLLKGYSMVETVS
jgi:hypothetical protein